MLKSYSILAGPRLQKCKCFKQYLFTIHLAVKKRVLNNTYLPLSCGVKLLV